MVSCEISTESSNEVIIILDVYTSFLIFFTSFTNSG